MSTRMPRLALATIAAAVLIGGYVGAYFVVVQMSPGYFIHRKEGRFGHRLFAPIHALDRRMRPHIWEPKP